MRRFKKRRYENYYALNKIITTAATLFFLGVTHYLDTINPIIFHFQFFSLEVIIHLVVI